MSLLHNLLARFTRPAALCPRTTLLLQSALTASAHLASPAAPFFTPSLPSPLAPTHTPDPSPAKLPLRRRLQAAPPRAHNLAPKKFEVPPK